MGLKAYFDGSGKGGDPQCKFLTLAGFSGTEETMVSFQEGWKQIVNDSGADYLHMAEAWPLKGQFSPDKRWTSKRRDDLVRNLIRYLADYRHFDETTDLLGFSCTIDLSAYRRVLSCRRLKEAESICVDHCFGHQFHRLPKPSPGYLSLCFDQNEDFLHKANRIWKKRVQGQRSWWAKYVTEIASVDMRSIPAVQAADLVAWTVNRRHSQQSRDTDFIYIGLTLCAAIFHKTYDETALMTESHVTAK